MKSQTDRINKNTKSVKLLIFGIGYYYQVRKKMIPKHAEIVGYVDNHVTSEYMNGKKIYLPNQIAEIEYDYVVLMSLQSHEMKKQLLKLGIEESKIKNYEEFLAIIYANQFFVFSGKQTDLKKKKSLNVLVAYTTLSYAGGTMTAIESARLLQKKYNVDVAVTHGDDKFIRLLNEEGINVIVCPTLMTLKYKDNPWIQKYDVVLANTVGMMRFAMEISNYRPVLLWLHDPLSFVKREQENHCFALKKRPMLQIAAVSHIAKRNFEEVFGKTYDVKILQYGIPDTSNQNVAKKRKDKMIFALIGWVNPIKGQDILVRAVQQMTKKEREQFEVWFVGAWDNISEYCLNVKSEIAESENMKIIGELDREEMKSLYADIDVVISASREDCFPIVLLEGMMNEKLCISSDATGVSKYLVTGKNGLLFESENVEELTQQIRWVINNKDKIADMGKHAKETYRKELSENTFRERLYDCMTEMEDQVKERQRKC